MSETNHTPGPWNVLPAKDKRPYWDDPKTVRPAGVREEPMIVVFRGELNSGGGIAYVWDWQGKGAMEANASLIAAAPDLLVACKMVLDDPGLTASANDVLCAAIALAEGRAS